MKQELRLVLVPTAICVFAGLSLAIVHSLTAERIRNVEAARRRTLINEVLPPGGEAPVEFPLTDKETGATNAIFHVARTADGRYIGAATEIATPNGYAGEIRLIVGFNHFDELHAIAVLDHRETPGLGARIDRDDFKATYPGRSLFDTRWALERDGGDLDSITAATVTSRAVAEAVANAVTLYLTHKERLTAPPQPPLTLEELLEDDLEELLDEMD